MQQGGDSIYRWWLYILRCEDGKFYVGITSKTPETRLHEHQNGVRTAYWTAKHRPIEVIYSDDLGRISKAKAERRENKMVRALMRQRGLNNVRGGDLCDVDEYIQRFGWIIDKSSWKMLTYSIYLIVMLVAFWVDKYAFPFLPGGVN